MMNRRLLQSAIALVFAGSLAACGSDSSSKSTSAPTTAAAAAAAAAATTGTTTTGAAATGASSLALATDAKFGPVLVDAQGYSLYLFTKDTSTTTACSGGCAKAWPPATVTGAPAVGAGLDAALVGVAAQADGTMQLTYGGHLLYRFAGDTGPGQVNGQDSNGVWYLVDASGKEVDDS